MFGVARFWRTTTRNYTSTTSVLGEVHAFEPTEWASYYGAAAQAGGVLDGMHLPFNRGLLGLPWSAEKVRAAVDAAEAALPEGAWPNWTLGNHDEPRIGSRLGPPQAAGLTRMGAFTPM